MHRARGHYRHIVVALDGSDEFAEARQCDLIVMGCRTGIETDDKLGESVSIAVSQRARVPVLVLRP